MSTAVSSSSFSALYNYLPLIVCRFMNSPRENAMTNSASEAEFTQQKLAYVDLLLLVFEKNGHLFLALPRLTSGHHLSQPSPGGVENIGAFYEQLLLEELNISLAYSALQLLSTSFFAAGKSVKQLEVVVSTCLPFGTLIKDGAELRSMITPMINSEATKSGSSREGESAVLRLVLNEFISTSFQGTSSSSSSAQLSRDQSETLFGTLTVEPGALIIRQQQQLARAELKVAVDNLGAFSVAKPPNCDNSSSSTSLLFDLKHCKLEPFNTLHFRLMGDEDSSTSPGGGSGGGSDQNRRKLFTYRYRVAPRSSSNNNSSTSRSNLQHLSLGINFNSSRLDTQELKFALFVVKFSFKNSSSKQQQAAKAEQGGVQTADSASVVNLIVRESIKASFGQVRNEASNSCFSWIIGQRLPKSGALSLEFDLLADDAKLANLETLCTFRLDHKLATKMAYTKRTDAGVSGAKARGSLSASSGADLEEVRECSLRQLLGKVISEPSFAIGKLVLTTEVAGPVGQSSLQQLNSESKGGGSLVTVEYRLTSFEYRLLPELPTTPATRSSLSQSSVVGIGGGRSPSTVVTASALG